MGISEKSLLQSRKIIQRFGITLTVVGLGLFILGAKPEWLGVNGSEAIGFVQIGVFSFGLFVLCLGSTITIDLLWRGHRTIVADIGLRLTWTGFVFSVFASLADLLGISRRQFPYFTPFFGYWQARGVLFGEILMAIGLMMMVPFKPIVADNDKSGDQE